MPDPKANSPVITAPDEFILATADRQKRDSLLRLRIIGAAVIIGLVILGFVFPVII